MENKKLHLHWNDNKPDNRTHISEDGNICLCNRKVYCCKVADEQDIAEIDCEMQSKKPWQYCGHCLNELRRLRKIDKKKAQER